MIYSLLSIFGILFTILFVVGTHEAAHFIVARLLGIKVLRFSIGFGKKLWHRTDKSGTEYVIALIPLGGYVQMLDENEGDVPEKDLHLAFNRQPFYKKIFVVIAGPLSNIFCALLLYGIVFMIGFKTIVPFIGHINPHSIAAEAKLKANQEIISIDHKSTSTWASVVFKLFFHAGNQDNISMEVRNICPKLPVGKTCVVKNETHLLDLSTWHINELNPDPLKSLGIVPHQPDVSLIREIKYPPIKAFSHAAQTIYDFTYFNFLIIGKMLTGKLSLQSLGGPIMIFESASDAINYGFLPFISFLAFLSLSIGIVNFLPIPGLDGGHLLIYIIEFTVRRSIPIAVLDIFYRAGLVFIFFLLIQALLNDILRLY